MEVDIDVYKLSKFYEVLNDFTRLKILKCISEKEVTTKEIASSTKLSEIVVIHQIRYLVENRIVKSLPQEDETIKYKIKDEYILKKLRRDLKYLERGK